MKILFYFFIILMTLHCDAQFKKKDGSTVFMSGTNMFFKNNSLNPGIEFVFSTTVVDHLYVGMQVGITHLRELGGVYFPIAADFKVTPVDPKQRLRPYLDISAGYGIRNRQTSASTYSKGGFFGEAGAGFMDSKSHMNLSVKYVNSSFKTTSGSTELLKYHLEGVVLNLGVFF